MPIPRPIHHLGAHICMEVSGCPPTHTLILQHHAPPHSGPVNAPSCPVMPRQSQRPIRRHAFRNELLALQRHGNMVGFNFPHASW
ncbi:hypothetical protein CGRA01v4_04959 [Colletotrichum graminicola]|nr:hypothetical protein CGRA01v4_04959 [Colletotrichum graminicola]